jgi:hypothetical protein
MPGFDGTGPMGMGPMTGGGRGFCNPFSPLQATGLRQRAYGFRPMGLLPAGSYPPMPTYGPGYYPSVWFGRGLRPMMGGGPRFRGARGGRGRGGRGCGFRFFGW